MHSTHVLDHVDIMHFQIAICVPLRFGCNFGLFLFACACYISADELNSQRSTPRRRKRSRYPDACIHWQVCVFITTIYIVPHVFLKSQERSCLFRGSKEAPEGAEWIGSQGIHD